jgi:hypothetical protein
VISAAPKILAFETGSAWAVILAVSLVTLPLALLLRRLIARPGGFASGLLVSLPLIMPLVAAVAYGRGAFPEVAVLKPIGPALIEQSRDLGSFLLVWDRDSGVYLPYAVLGSQRAIRRPMTTAPRNLLTSMNELATIARMTSHRPGEPSTA